MKSVTVEIEKEQLDRIFREMAPGDAVVLTDGMRRITLESLPAFDAEQDSPELERELLKGISSPISDYSISDLEGIIKRVRAEKRQ